MPDAKGHGDMHLAGVLRTSLGVQLCLEGSRWASWSKPRPAPEPLSNAKAEITGLSYRMCWVTLARPKALFTGNEKPTPTMYINRPPRRSRWFLVRIVPPAEPVP